MPPDVAAPSVTAPARVAPTELALARRVHWVLRVGAAACFIGHGAFGLLTKPEWVAYFAVVGIPRDAAFALMPLVGAVDVAAGLVTLLSPRPAVLLYMAAWGLWTALLRPLAGDHAWEAVERAGNYGVPLALLLWSAPFRGGLAPLGTGTPPAERRAAVARVLRWTVALLLAGHGALGALVGKPLLARHWAAVGLPAGTAAVAGSLELALAAAVLWRPNVALLAAVALWKLATEALFPVAGAPAWEVVERGGSYAAPLALALLAASCPPVGVRGSFAPWTRPRSPRTARAPRSRSSSPSPSR